MFRQSPQFIVSVRRSTHLPSHADVPKGQAMIMDETPPPPNNVVKNIPMDKKGSGAGAFFSLAGVMSCRRGIRVVTVVSGPAAAIAGFGGVVVVVLSST
jgi:hypothetical protein